jgi:hypothetical protein
VSISSLLYTAPLECVIVFTVPLLVKRQQLSSEHSVTETSLNLTLFTYIIINVLLRRELQKGSNGSSSTAAAAAVVSGKNMSKRVRGVVHCRVLNSRCRAMRTTAAELLSDLSGFKVTNTSSTYTVITCSSVTCCSVVQ